jgi:hypothetical protein
MENHDSRIAQSHGASTDERASSFHPQDAGDAPPAAAVPHAMEQPVRFPDPEPHAPDEDGPFQSFATDAEAEAYYKGLTAGIRAAGREPGHPHMPSDFSLDLMRDPEAPPLTSTKLVEAYPLIPGEGAEKAARAERQDGWTGDKMKRFLDVLADTGVVTDACRATGMSRRSAYALRNSARGRAFALGWDAALLLSAPSVADDVASRSRYGVVDRVYRNGELIAERHRYDNRLTMAVLTRLDRQLKEMRADHAAAARLAADEWEQYTALVAAGEGADAFLAARVPAAPGAAPKPAAACEAALLGRLATFARFGVGLPSEISVADLVPAEMEGWTGDQIARAEASGFLARLAPEAWPQSVREGEGDGTDGMCELRYLHAKYAPPPPQAEPVWKEPVPEVDDFEACETWQDDEGVWCTNFPPPPGFDGEQEGDPLDPAYLRELTAEEQARLPASAFKDDDGTEEDRLRSAPDAAELAALHAARRRYFRIAEEEEQGLAGAVAGEGGGTRPPLLADGTGFAGLARPCAAFMAGTAATPLAEKSPGK